MKKIYTSILLILPTTLAFISSIGQIYGSKIDWLSQHIILGDLLRNTQNYVSTLQGGTNIYSFSYYGLFRPDMWFSKLFLDIDIKYFIIGYALLLWTITGILCFKWLLNKGYRMDISFFVSILCVSSNCFFHTHQQVMFVEILPFLFASFILIDAHKKQWISICICLAMFHNYFYTPGFILIVWIYNFYQDRTIFDLILPTLLGIGLSCILWLPTGLLILENKKSVTATSVFSLLIPNLSLKGILYDAYGCGCTLIAWIALFQGLVNPKLKQLSILLLLMFLFPIFSYILNGTLYARSKILILCLPLVLYIVCEWLESKTINLWCLLMSFCFVTQFYIYDAILVLIFIYYYFKENNNKALIYSIIPCLVFLSLNMHQGLSYKIYDSVYDQDKQALIQRNKFENRTADLDQIYKNSNHTYSKLKKASSYTSTSNSLYNAWFYDIVKNPISQTNRTVLADSENYVYLGLMSIENVIVKKDNLYGYKMVDQQGKYKVLKNKDVLPIAYVTGDVMFEKQFDQLKYPYTLDTLYNRTIVHGKQSVSYSSRMTKVKSVHKKIKIRSKKKQKKKIDLDFETQNKMVCIDFYVKNNGDKKVWITINGMKNTLSKKDSVYQNENNHFTYVLSKKKLDQLKITCSKGNYEIKNIRIYTCDMDAFSRKVKKVRLKKTSDVLKGTVTCSSGYLVTSIPYENGYELYVDGKSQKIEIVNKAFIGSKITSGTHLIVLKFKAPGQDVSAVVSLASVLLGGYYIWKRSKN